MDHWFQTYSSLGAGAYILWANQRNRLREKLGLLLGCDKDDIGLLGQTGRGQAKPKQYDGFEQVTGYVFHNLKNGSVAYILSN